VLLASLSTWLASYSEIDIEAPRSPTANPAGSSKSLRKGPDQSNNRIGSVTQCSGEVLGVLSSSARSLRLLVCLSPRLSFLGCFLVSALASSDGCSEFTSVSLLFLNLVGVTGCGLWSSCVLAGILVAFWLVLHWCLGGVVAGQLDFSLSDRFGDSLFSGRVSARSKWFLLVWPSLSHF